MPRLPRADALLPHVGRQQAATWILGRAALSPGWLCAKLPIFSAAVAALNIRCSAMRPIAGRSRGLGRHRAPRSALARPALLGLRGLSCCACRAAPGGLCAAMLRGLSCRLSRYAARARRPLVPRQGRPARGRPPLDKGCRACTYPGPCDYIQYIIQASGKQDVCMILHNGA